MYTSGWLSVFSVLWLIIGSALKKLPGCVIILVTWHKAFSVYALKICHHYNMLQNNLIGSEVHWNVDMQISEEVGNVVPQVI